MRVTPWGLLLGCAVINLVQLVTDQVSVQRDLTATSLKEAQRALWLKFWLLIPVFIVFYLTGLGRGNLGSAHRWECGRKHNAKRMHV